MHLWCHLIPIATTTLNLLRPSRIKPKLSAETLPNGAFDYNKTPLAPPGTIVFLHETPEKRGTWAPYGVDGWYIGAAPEQYHCHRIFLLQTRKEHIAHAMEFLPHDFAMPTTSSTDAAILSTQDLFHALHHPKLATLSATVQSDQDAALATLSESFFVTYSWILVHPRITPNGAHITGSPYHASESAGYITRTPIACPGSHCLPMAIHHRT